MTSTVEVSARVGVSVLVKSVRPDTNLVFEQDRISGGTKRLFSVRSDCTLVIAEIHEGDLDTSIEAPAASATAEQPAEG